ncbi:MAG: mandelate racemase/muconate lactonizing enzyme family protein [Chloroflexota bacterium]|mgnify:FL=1|nr:mandelate racemase/muconate lactonizing enzyme family protein [Chloroflexota bacterium]MEC8440150.1 mandelate racemase/muconate lactonizing enzyme family protein [Chloroflexota bacterium]
MSNFSTNSSPSDLKITDMRIAVVGEDNWRWPIIKIYTNQDIVGLGEVRDGASARYALMLKSRLLGENPCDVERLFKKIKQFGGHGRLGGGVCGVEMALMDLAGKAYGVPAYMLAGGKYRDQIRVYSDTPSKKDPVEMGNALKERMERGFTYLKMDIGIWISEQVEGGLVFPNDYSDDKLNEGSTGGSLKSMMVEAQNVMHPFTGIQLTDKGISEISEYVKIVRDIVGYEIPIATDHFGHIGLESCIRLGKELDKYSLAWYEDMIPWQYTNQWKQLKNSVDTPVCTGEDIYLLEGFKPLIDNEAVSIIHPDLATSGGILETKKIGDYAQEKGIPMALHQAGSPIVAMANVHCAAATEGFIALEMHSVDNPWWDDLVNFETQKIINNGFVKVPESPGLGITLNEDAVEKHLNVNPGGWAGQGKSMDIYPKGAFEPTEEWDKLDSHDRTWS